MNAARAQPGALTFASTGPASPSQIAFEMLERAANVQMIYVPFPGNAPTVNAVLGGHVTAGIANYADVVGHLKAGTLRALVTPSSIRVEFAAGSADRRRVRPQGIRVRGLVRDACAGADPERNDRPALGLVCRGDAGTRGERRSSPSRASIPSGRAGRSSPPLSPGNSTTTAASFAKRISGPSDLGVSDTAQADDPVLTVGACRIAPSRRGHPAFRCASCGRRGTAPRGISA